MGKASIQYNFSMRVRIVGRGSVGTAVGENLKQAEDCAFVVGQDRKNRCLEPVLFNGEELPLKTLLAEEGMEKADLVILAVKNFQLESALPVVRFLVGDNTTILPILNGIDAEETLKKEFGEEKVLYGFISGLSLSREGNVVTSLTKGKITFGEKTNERSERVEAISKFFSENQLNHVIPSDILHEKWWKFMNNTAFNTLTAVLGAEYGVTGSNVHLVEAARMIFKEVQAVGKASGVFLTDDDVESVISAVKTLGGHGKSSMLEDVLNHHMTENAYFCGSIARLGKAYGIPTPHCDLMEHLLEAKRYVVNFS